MSRSYGPLLAVADRMEQGGDEATLGLPGHWPGLYQRATAHRGVAIAGSRPGRWIAPQSTWRFAASVARAFQGRLCGIEGGRGSIVCRQTCNWATRAEQAGLESEAMVSTASTVSRRIGRTHNCTLIEHLLWYLRSGATWEKGRSAQRFPVVPW